MCIKNVIGLVASSSLDQQKYFWGFTSRCKEAPNSLPIGISLIATDMNCLPDVQLCSVFAASLSLEHPQRHSVQWQLVKNVPNSSGFDRSKLSWFATFWGHVPQCHRPVERGSMSRLCQPLKILRQSTCFRLEGRGNFNVWDATGSFWGQQIDCNKSFGLDVDNSRWVGRFFG